MDYAYNNIKINYLKAGQGSEIILLHGWGQNLHTFDQLIEILKVKYTIYGIDLPGFGLSDEPEEPWSINDYSDLVKVFCKDLNIYKPDILGHSFGGRIAIKYASTSNNLNRLILVNSAGLNLKRGPKFYLKRWHYKIVKYFYQITKNDTKKEEWFDRHASADYKAATEKMRATFNKVVNEDLSKDLLKIGAETLLIWGEKDTVIPIECGLKMQKKIANAGLVRLEGLGHFPYLEDTEWFNIIIKNYLGIS